MSSSLIRGAEAEIHIKDSLIIKKRIKKGYRITEIDLRLRKSRTKREAKAIEKCISLGLSVPKLVSCSEKDFELSLERVKGKQLRQALNKTNFREYGDQIAVFLTVIHDAGIIHHDLTTSNMIAAGKKLFFIDFGLSFFSHKPEDKAVDLHLLERALQSKHPSLSDKMFRNVISRYNAKDKEEVLARLRIVQSRGRNKAKRSD